MQRVFRRVGLVAVIFAAGYALGQRDRNPLVASAEATVASDRVFELRTYTAPEGKLDELEARFRNHTLAYFEKHGMTNVAYWKPLDAPASENTLIYLLAHDSREAARESWAAFSADPGWREVSAASQVNGRIVSKAESVFLDPTDYSPLK